MIRIDQPRPFHVFLLSSVLLPVLLIVAAHTPSLGWVEIDFSVGGHIDSPYGWELNPVLWLPYHAAKLGRVIVDRISESQYVSLPPAILPHLYAATILYLVFLGLGVALGLYLIARRLSPPEAKDPAPPS